MNTSLSRSIGQNPWFIWLLVVGSSALTLRMVLGGQIELLFILVMGGTALIFLSFHPVTGLVLLLLIDLQFFNFIQVDALPYFQVTSSLRINSQDMLTILLLARSIFVLTQKRERPLFLRPLLLLFGVTVLSFLFGIVSGTASFEMAGRIFRFVIKYGIYFIIVATINSRQSLETLIKVLYLFAIIGLVLQFIEKARGAYLVLNYDWDPFLQGIPYYLLLGGSSVPYIWNRAQFYLYIASFFTLASLLLSQRINRWHLVFVCMSGLGFVLMLIRSWYIFISVGTMVMLLLSPSRRRLRLFTYGLISALLLFLGMTLIGELTTLTTFGQAGIENFVFRLQTLQNFQMESSFLGRVDLWKIQLANFYESPLFGLGPGSQALYAINTDTGLVNTLLLYGIVGLLAVFVLIIAIFRQAYRLWRQLRSLRERAYVLGMIAGMAGVTFGYGFSFDAFTLSPIIPVLVMGLLDRIKAFYTPT